MTDVSAASEITTEITTETVPPLRHSRLNWRRKHSVAPRPRSKAARRAGAFTSALVLAYALLACFPQVLFAQSVSYKRFRVYSFAPLNPQLYPVLDKAEEKLTRSELNDPELTYRLFICPNHALFAFFNPNGRQAFACNLPFSHNIFINTADIARDRVTTQAAKNNRRTLSGVIAHECTHTLLAQALGEAGVLRVPSWKKEGYCDFVARETSFDPNEGTRLLQQGGTDASPSFFYFKACAATRCLLEDHHLSVRQAMSDKETMEDILDASILRSR